MKGADTQQRESDWFGMPLASGELKRRSVRGTFASVLSGWANQLVGFGGLVFLGRMLTPGDFGLIAMISAIVGIASVFQNLGFSGATIRAAIISHHQTSNLFWINLFAGTTMTLLVAMAAPLLEAFYHDPRVLAPTMAMSLNFALDGASTQHFALLRRAMRFTDLARISIFAITTTTVVSIAAAFFGMGYWSIVLGSLAGNSVGLILSWRFCDWRPGKPKRHVGTKSLAVFGFHLMIFGVFGYLAKNLHNMLIGRFWGAAETGLYNRAANSHAILMGNVLEPLGLVAPAAMARLADEPEKYKSYYYKGCSLAVAVVMPIVFLGLVLPSEFLLVLLGKQWERSAGLLRLLAFGILPQTISYTSGWVYLSGGKSAQMMRWGAIGWTAIIAGTVAGSFFGLEGIAAASSVTGTLLVVPCLLFAFSGTSLDITELFRVLRMPIAAGLVSGAICWAGLHLLINQGPSTRLLAGGASYLIIYLALLMTVFAQRNLIMDIVLQLKKRNATAS